MILSKHASLVENKLNGEIPHLLCYPARHIMRTSDSDRFFVIVPQTDRETDEEHLDLGVFAFAKLTNVIVR
jgi:hypothetical protein